MWCSIFRASKHARKSSAKIFDSESTHLIPGKKEPTLAKSLFINNSSSNGKPVYINLGSISESNGGVSRGVAANSLSEILSVSDKSKDAKQSDHKEDKSAFGKKKTGFYEGFEESSGKTIDKCLVSQLSKSSGLEDDEELEGREESDVEQEIREVEKAVPNLNFKLDLSKLMTKQLLNVRCCY